MFPGTKITITEDDITGWSDDFVSDTNTTFYLERYAATQEFLVEGNLIHCFPLDKKFGMLFSQSPPFILNTKNDLYQNIFKATNYGMVIYSGFDPEQSLFNIDTQSLYFCTKIVVITDNHIVDIHFPIDEEYLANLTDETINDFIYLLKKMGINPAESKWYTISGNLRDMETGSLKESNVSKQFVERLLDRLVDDFGFSRENHSEIDMQIKIDYQVNFKDKSLIPTTLYSPKRESSCDSQSYSSDSIQSRTSVSSFSSWSSEELESEIEEKFSIHAKHKTNPEKTSSKNKTASPLLKNSFINSMEKKTELPKTNLEQPEDEAEALTFNSIHQSEHETLQLTNQEKTQQDTKIEEDSHKNPRLTRSPRPDLASLSTPRANKKPLL